MPAIVLLFIVRLYLLQISAMFLNLENFFDYRDGGTGVSDTEFSSRGARHWTRKKFEFKTLLVAKTILWSGTPEVAGFAELENGFVLRSIRQSAPLYKLDYRQVHYDSKDPRGIDVGLIYLADSMELVSSRSLPVKEMRAVADGPPVADTLATRDILYVCLRRRSTGELWHFFVNHHPSKYGGKSSSGRRILAMSCLLEEVGRLLDAGDGNIVAMGDFNDTPDGEAFKMLEKPPYDTALVNMGAASGAVENGEGSIRFHGNWQLIDNFIVSADVARKAQMAVLRPPFLMERDRTYPGEKPRRTFVGPRYNGGVSDHLPVMLKTNAP